MHPILRVSRSTAATPTTLIRSICSYISPNGTYSHQLTRAKRYIHESNKPQGGPIPASPKSRELEHPGPPPPNVSEISQNTGAELRTDVSEELQRQKRQQQKQQKQEQEQQQEQQQHQRESYPDLEHQPQRKEPSNKAHPTLTDGRESPNVDLQGNVRADVPEDVKQHNRELQQRYDRAYNQIADGGKVSKGFWKGGGSLSDDKGGARRDGGH